MKKVLQSAIANAENNHDLDVDDLVVAEASVGKNLVHEALPCARPRPWRPRREAVLRQMTIVVEERREGEGGRKAARPETKRRAKAHSNKKPSNTAKEKA